MQTNFSKVEDCRAGKVCRILKFLLDKRNISSYFVRLKKSVEEARLLAPDA